MVAELNGEGVLPIQIKGLKCFARVIGVVLPRDKRRCTACVQQWVQDFSFCAAAPLRAVGVRPHGAACVGVGVQAAAGRVLDAF